MCNRIFTGGNKRSPEQITEKYYEGKKTYMQLATKYGCSTKTIQRYIDKSELTFKREFPSTVNLVIDTTYFGRNFGVMLFNDSITKVILYKHYVKYETISEYLSGIMEIRRRGLYIHSIICDGKRGLFTLFDVILVQMCHFHQQQIVRRYLTLNPKTEA